MVVGGWVGWGGGDWLPWSLPDAVCRSGLSPASPHMCTHKADMAQPETQKHKHSPSFLLVKVINVNGFFPPC